VGGRLQKLQEPLPLLHCSFLCWRETSVQWSNVQLFPMLQKADPRKERPYKHDRDEWAER